MQLAYQYIAILNHIKSSSDSDVFLRQNLTSKVGPSTERVKT